MPESKSDTLFDGPPPWSAVSDKAIDESARRKRVEPRLIRILPQPLHPRDALAMSILPGFVLVLMAVGLVALDQPHANSTAPSKIETAAWWLGGAGAVLAVVIGIPATLLSRYRQRFLDHCRRQQQAGEFQGEVLTQRRGAPRWNSPEEQMRELAVEYITGRHPRAWIVCLGAVDVPPPDDMPFEPEILPAARLFWDLSAIAAACLVVGLAMVWATPLSGSIALPLGQHPIVPLIALVFAGPVLVRWFWLAFVRPRYLRLAPGVIQILEYKWGRGRPSVRGFPIEGGTLVVLTNQLWGDLTLSIMRDERSFSFPLPAGGRGAAMRALVWRALTCRAMTPPLSDEGLVG